MNIVVFSHPNSEVNKTISTVDLGYQEADWHAISRDQQYQAILSYGKAQGWPDITWEDEDYIIQQKNASYLWWRLRKGGDIDKKKMLLDEVDNRVRDGSVSKFLQVHFGPQLGCTLSELVALGRNHDEELDLEYIPCEDGAGYGRGYDRFAIKSPRQTSE